MFACRICVRGCAILHGIGDVNQGMLKRKNLCGKHEPMKEYAFTLVNIFINKKHYI